ncbi:MAG: aldehyde dehydrogenase family protein [Phycisphaeraceae bacterium]|nr:MAG: aldehyde dehydrogenase family protein [Phycisphaeraceae bacterium]
MSTTGVKHPSLANPPSNLIGGRAIELTGAGVRSHNPARPQETVWAGDAPIEHVDMAVAAANKALPAWARAPREQRFEALRIYQRLLKDRVDDIADLICDETGKALWEAKQEAGLLGGKVDITLDDTPGGPLSRVTGFDTKITDTRTGRCVFRPHGVMAVLGPFNFPAHLANGHIVPALAVGCTVVLKPSDKTPGVGQLMGEIMTEALRQAGAPDGVVNVIQGAADVASALSRHSGVNGILFTGSWPVGRKILESNLDTPGRIVALELGGNNPAIVMDDADLRLAAIECARAAFATTGQRCTCTRRIIVHERIADRFIPALCKAASALVIGAPRAEHPVFMGPVIRAEARDAALRFVADLSKSGAEILVEPGAPTDVPGAPGGHFISPAVARVDRFSLGDDAGRDAGCDIEVFGPVVRICVVKSLDEAIEQANTTRYGLAASIFTQSEQSAERFLFDARAGCVNVNAGTAGASGKLPFGGLGLSGNHRPAGAFSLDYCAYPVASLIERADGSTAALSPGMRFEDSWLG